eukprot:CAMPEP_0179366918 /NCGR_PEP_ID=MMETSP0797-20121207/83306_1 /TAXON_ID=47934 /ORGANISM="Dinophysis acuminata, Strain DAEP01" /LENGTH=330 /DNA_ID=CAMNT_0021082451 /DNA_START=22 /DNA_END=1012 /DNA_ORIENTATION=-
MTRAAVSGGAGRSGPRWRAAAASARVARGRAAAAGLMVAPVAVVPLGLGGARAAGLGAVARVVLPAAVVAVGRRVRGVGAARALVPRLVHRGEEVVHHVHRVLQLLVVGGHDLEVEGLVHAGVGALVPRPLAIQPNQSSALLADVLDIPPPLPLQAGERGKAVGGLLDGDRVLELFRRAVAHEVVALADEAHANLPLPRLQVPIVARLALGPAAGASGIALGTAVDRPLAPPTPAASVVVLPLVVGLSLVEPTDVFLLDRAGAIALFAVYVSTPLLAGLPLGRGLSCKRVVNAGIVFPAALALAAASVLALATVGVLALTFASVLALAAA